MADLLPLAAAAASLVAACLAWLAWAAARQSATRDAIERLRLGGEQLLAGLRAEAETTRAHLAAAERALASGSAESRLAVETRLGALTASLAREQGETRVQIEARLREMADASALRLAEIQRSVNEQLHAAVEKQMQTSFSRVLDQFTAVQKAMGDVAAMTAQIGDLKRVFSNVKTRGTWGEAQLRSVLDDLLGADNYVANARLPEFGGDCVEFAVRMPGRGEAGRKLLPIDAKFPVSDYERLLAASEAGDAAGERAARAALETRFRAEARKIGEKYIRPPATTDFAILYLPTDGLYAEAARNPGLIDDIGRQYRVLPMGPSLLPALLRTVQLGYVSLALEEKAGQIGKLLGATRAEMKKMDDTLEKLSKNAGAMARTIEDARTRTRVVSRKLREVEQIEAAEAERLLELGEDVG